MIQLIYKICFSSVIFRQTNTKVGTQVVQVIFTYREHDCKTTSNVVNNFHFDPVRPPPHHLGLEIVFQRILFDRFTPVHTHGKRNAFLETCAPTLLPNHQTLDSELTWHCVFVGEKIIVGKHPVSLSPAHSSLHCD